MDRFDVYRRMRASGVGVVALYHTLVDAIDPDALPGRPTTISRRILNLPIHQDVESDEEARSIGAALKNALGGSSWRRRTPAHD